jgi:putative pyruvate formate lyase activating enzyme
MASLARACHHLGEEPPLSGTRGAGTLFLAGCNLGCTFCQNHQVSRTPSAGRTLGPEALALEMLALQVAGCHNVELVTPTHALPALMEALDQAAAQGLSLPLVHNGSGYERAEVLALLDGVVDIYLPDLKYGDDEGALIGSGVSDYVAQSRAAVLEMARQVGSSLTLDSNGLARKGLIVRHLVLPGGLASTSSVLGFIATELGPRTSLSLMSQYRPPTGVNLPAPLDRPLDPREYQEAEALLECWGLTSGWSQATESRDSYVPDFTREDHPFEGMASDAEACSCLTKGGAGRAK